MNKRKRPPILLAFALLLSTARAILTGEVTVTPTTVSSTAQLLFEMVASEQIPTNGKLVMTFSSGFNLQQSPGISCASVYALDDLSGCTVDSKTQLTLSNAKTSDYLALFTVNNVVLPSYVSSFFVIMRSYDSNGVQIEASGPTALAITTQPATLNVGLRPSSQVVGEMTDLQISISSPSAIAQSGYVEIKLPKWNSGTQQIGLALPYFDVSSLPMSMQGSYQIPCSAQSHPSLYCQFTVSNVQDVSQISQTYDTLKISQLSRDSKELVVQTAGSLFRNPPSTKTVSTFQAASYIQTGFFVAQVSKISLKITEAAQLDPSFVQMVAQDGDINTQTAYECTVQMPLPGPVGLKILIEIPLSLGLTAISDPSQYVLTSAAGYLPIAEIPHLQIVNQEKQQVMLSLLVPNANYFVDQGNFVKFDLFDIVNPPSSHPSDSFKLTFYEFDDVIMTVTSGVKITASPGNLQSLSVTPEGYRVRDKVPYSFSFVTTNRVFTDSLIKISVPPELLIDPSQLSLIPVTALSEDGSAVLSYDASTSTMQIKNAFPFDYTTPQLVEFVINTGIQNAQSTEPISAFVVSTIDTNGALIDLATSQPLAFTPNEISGIVVTACADKATASETEDVCTYQLQFTMGAQYPIMAGSSIEVDLPDDLSLSVWAQTESRSSTVGVADLSAKFQVINSGKTVRVNNAFVQSSAPNGIDYRQDSFAVQIASVKSPRTTAPTLSFKARILSSEGYLQYTRQQGVYSNVFQARPFQNLVIKRTNETNGADTGFYNFTLQFSSVVYKNEYIKITPPGKVVIYPGGSGQCSGIRGLTSLLACSIIDGSLYVLIDPATSGQTQFNPGDIVQFQVSNIRNPQSLEPTTSFAIYVVTTTSQNYYVNQLTQGLSILNDREGALTNVRVTPDTNSFSVVTDYQIYFITANPLGTGSQIKIQFPEDFYRFSGSSIPCTAIKNIQSTLQCKVSDGNIITITRGFQNTRLAAGTEIGFQLEGIRNPTKSVSNTEINQSFFIETIDRNNYGIDRSYELDFSIGCTFPCKSCDSVQTQCTSCENLNAKTPLFLYQSTCNAECPISTYADENGVCQACDPLCKQCSSSPDICDSCREELGFPYVTPQGTCTQKCSSGTYLDASSKQCLTCEGNCDTCTSAIECLSCEMGFYYIEGRCLASCPSNSIQFDSVEVQECLKCTEPCASCEETVDKCTSCSPATFLYENQCLAKCPATYLPDDNNVCYQASEPTYPFIFQITTACIVILITASYVVSKDTQVWRVFLSLESAAMLAFWIYMLVFLIRDGHTASSTLVSIAIFFNFVINYLWWEYYNDKLYKRDTAYQDYCAQYPRTTALIKFVSLFTAFDFFRISFSHLFGLPQLQADMLKKDKLYKRINRYELFQITFVYLLTMIAASFNLFYTWYGRQIFWIDIECLAMGAFMLAFKLILIFKSEKEYIQNLKDLQARLENHKAMGETDDPADESDDYTGGAQKVAASINDQGVERSRGMIKKLSNKERAQAMRAVFKSLLPGTDKDYLYKHGAQVAQKFRTTGPQVESGRRPLVGQQQSYDELAGDTLQINNTTELPDLHTQALNQEDRDLGDSDLQNFTSAPLNADQALQNNKQLEMRHDELQQELRQRKNRPKNKNWLANIELEDRKQQAAIEKLMSGMGADSDDEAEEFTEEKWGKDAPKVVADHYNAVQARERAASQLPQLIESDGSRGMPKQTKQPPAKFTHQQIKEKLDEVKVQQKHKRLAKEQANELAESSRKLEADLTKQTVENDKLREFIKQLEMQIASEQGRLYGVKLAKREEVELAENAFYTSNEDAMGVSPNHFSSQNRPTRPAHKKKSSSREAPPPMPVNEERIVFQHQALNQFAGATTNDDMHSGRAGLERSANVSQNEKSITAEEIKAMGIGLTQKGHSDANEVLQSSFDSKAKMQNSRKSLTKKRSSQRKSNNTSVNRRNQQESSSGPNNVGSSSQGRKNRNKTPNESSGRKASSKKKKSLTRQRHIGTLDSETDGAGLGTSQMSALVKRGRSTLSQKAGTLRRSSPGGKIQKIRSSSKEKSTSRQSPSRANRSTLRDSPSRANRSTVRESPSRLNKSTSRRSPSRGAKSNNTTTVRRSKRNPPLATEGKASRKPHQTSNSQAGVKPANKANNYESRSQKTVKLRPLNNEKDQFEYYTSEDELGLPVNKLRRKAKDGGSSKKKSKKRSSRKKREDKSDEMEFYSTLDNEGNKVQKLRRKDRKGKSQQQRVKACQPEIEDQSDNLERDLTDFRPNPTQRMSVDQNSLMSSALGNDNFAKLPSLGSHRSQVQTMKQRADNKRSRSNNAPDLTFKASATPSQVRATTGDGSTSRNQERARPTTEEGSHHFKDRNLHSSALRDAGITVVKASNSKSKPRRQKKQSVPQRDYSGPYFNHTNFERAVIATNGRAPYNNREVEAISKRFIPESFNFKNNWVNQVLLQDEELSPPRTSKQPKTQGGGAAADIASASVTATTVFQGINASQLMGSLSHTHIKGRHTNAGGQGMSQTQQDFGGYGSSPTQSNTKKQ